MNACGDTGDAGDSVGGGAGVNKRARISEKKFLWGIGNVTTLLEDSDDSHASRRRRPPDEGRDDGG